MIYWTLSEKQLKEIWQESGDLRGFQLYIFERINEEKTLQYLGDGYYRMPHPAFNEKGTKCESYA